jgi:hypothetical protein
MGRCFDYERCTFRLFLLARGKPIDLMRYDDPEGKADK